MALLRRTLAWGIRAWFAWRLLGPEIPPSGSGQQRRPLRMPGRSVFVGDHEFFVREAGPPDAPPVVLLHGWSFDGEMTFFNLVPELAERFRVIAPDNRGHGRSEWIRGRYEVADVADDVAGILDALEVKSAIVFGYSMGGMIAQELAHRRSELVSRLVLAATAARPVASNLGFHIALLLGRTITRISKKEFTAVSTAVLRRTKALGPEHSRWMWEGLMRRDANLYYEAGNAARRFDSRPWIRSLAMPTMVIVNTADQLVPTRAQLELASYFSDDDVVLLRGGRHESVMNRSDEYAKLIGEFADREL